MPNDALAGLHILVLGGGPADGGSTVNHRPEQSIDGGFSLRGYGGGAAVVVPARTGD